MYEHVTEHEHLGRTEGLYVQFTNVYMTALFGAVASVCGASLADYTEIDDEGRAKEASVWVFNEFVRSALLAEYQRYLQNGGRYAFSAAYPVIQPLD